MKSARGRCLESLTGVPWYRAWYAIVSVEQLPPKELISGDSQPLPAGQASSQHSIVGQQHKDLQHQAIRQNWDILHPNILWIQMGFFFGGGVAAAPL